MKRLILFLILLLCSNYFIYSKTSDNFINKGCNQIKQTSSDRLSKSKESITIKDSISIEERIAKIAKREERPCEIDLQDPETGDSYGCLQLDCRLRICDSISYGDFLLLLCGGCSLTGGCDDLPRCDTDGVPCR